jgi:hypothetical protein
MFSCPHPLFCDDGDIDVDDLDVFLTTFGMTCSTGASPPALILAAADLGAGDHLKDSIT